MKTFKAVQLEQLKRIQSSQLGTGSRGDVLEHQNPLKTSEKMDYFDRVTVLLHILFAGKPRD